MVFFTCNHCGESLKKPSVEKHYQWKSCREAVPFLTCVDCLKDFKGDEFKVHTKCISEEEKYSAKGFVAKPNKNKGAQKQESWTESLQNLISKPGINPQIKNIVERIAAQTNVPRKKPKFINFVKNSMKISLDNANKVWDVVEEALDEFKQIAEANRQKKEAEKKTENDVAESTKPAEKTINPENNQKAKKKKKKNGAKLEEDNVRAKKETKTENGAVELPDSTTNPENNQKTKKKKKKNGAKVEAANFEAKLENSENGNSRKRTMETSGDEGSAKKKKKKNNKNGKTESECKDESATANGNLNSEQEQDSIIAGDGKFDWQSAIISILSKKTAPMQINKLKSKVVKKYATQTSNGVSAGIEKKFLKKLKAMQNVTITNELVKFVK